MSHSMGLMMHYFSLFVLCILFWQPIILHASGSAEQKVLSHQMRRKLSFDQHLRDKEEYDRKRRKKAFLHKIVRVENELRKEKARLRFYRENREFPVVAWRRFLRERELKIAGHKLRRREYSRVRKVLRRLMNRKKYRIDKEKEYQL